MSTQHPLAMTEAQFKQISTRLKDALNRILGEQASNGQAQQILSSALYSKPYEEVKTRILSSAGHQHDKDTCGGGGGENEESASSPSHCEYCGSSDIEGGDPEVDGDSAFVPVHCNRCNSQWNEVYKFAGIEDFVEG